MRHSPFPISKRIAQVVPFLIIAIIGIILVKNAFFRVDPGQRGILVRPSGRVLLLPPGLHWKIPLIDTVRIEPRGPSNGFVRVRAHLKDLQSVEFYINWPLAFSEAELEEILTSHGTVATYVTRILFPLVSEAAEQATAESTMEDILINRTAFRQFVEERINQRLNAANEQISPPPPEIQALTITAIRLSAEVQRALDSRPAAMLNAASIRLEGTALQQYPKTLDFRLISEWNGRLPFIVGKLPSPFVPGNLSVKPEEPAPSAPTN